MCKVFASMRAFFKALMILVGMAFVGFGAILVHASWWSRGYPEAERMQPIVWEVAMHIRDLKSRREPLPASLEKLLSPLGREKRQKLQRYSILWESSFDPVLLVKINDRFGFAVDAGGNPSWLTDKLLEKYFPK